METVSLVKCGSYAGAGEAVRRAIKLSGGIRRKKRALIKVNLLSASPPEDCVTTHPAVVKAAILELQKSGAAVYVGDVPGFVSLEKAAKRAGISEVCEETGAELFEFGETGEYENPRATIAKKPRLYKSAFGFDMIANIPKLKTHSLTAYTGAVKNLFGFVPNAQRKFYHLECPDPVSFSRMLLDNYLLIRPQLNIMDAVEGMEGNGPSAGTPRKFGFIAAGSDALAIDTVCTDLLGIGEKVPLLEIARKTMEAGAFREKIRVEGDKIERITDLKLPAGSLLQVPAPFLRLARRKLAAKPVVRAENCTSCGTCAKACPAGAIRMEREGPASKNAKTKGRGEGRCAMPMFDYSKCVRCYTCQEMCPKNAIEIRQVPAVRAAMACVKRIRGRGPLAWHFNMRPACTTKAL